MTKLLAPTISVLIGLVVFLVASWIAGWDPNLDLLIPVSVVAAISDFLGGFGARIRARSAEHTATSKGQ
ncbi:hypothetical protein [Corynebacterium terpenotabidum]|uniref:Uncharacterized protein n=1 Tax=Corynebacterium terpenotabidum Y-11 TaxID=1200352 RepID=S4XHK6_9CORY|nr:hypothetical protein [Corynebacterium terpenotabidum]AGP32006.1 hypothetical protein A606_11835 [Corynebacterium terpenotabidum Y-11]